MLSGVMTSEFATIREDYMLDQYRLRIKMLDTAFVTLADNTTGTVPKMSRNRCFRVLECVAPPQMCTDRHRIPSPSTIDHLAEVGGEQFRRDADWRSLMMHLLDVDNSGVIENQEFRRLVIHWSFPIRLKKFKTIDELYALHLRKLEEALHDTASSCGQRSYEAEEVRQELQSVKMLSAGLWAAKYPKLYWLVEEAEHCGVTFKNCTAVLLLLVIILLTFWPDICKALNGCENDTWLTIVTTILLSLATVAVIIRNVALWPRQLPIPGASRWTFNYCVPGSAWFGVIDVLGMGAMWIYIIHKKVHMVQDDLNQVDETTWSNSTAKLGSCSLQHFDPFVTFLGVLRALLLARIVHEIEAMDLIRRCIFRVIPVVSPYFKAMLGSFSLT